MSSRDDERDVLSSFSAVDMFTLFNLFLKQSKNAQLPECVDVLLTRVQ